MDDDYVLMYENGDILVTAMKCSDGSIKWVSEDDYNDSMGDIIAIGKILN